MAAGLKQIGLGIGVVWWCLAVMGCADSETSTNSATAPPPVVSNPPAQTNQTNQTDQSANSTPTAQPAQSSQTEPTGTQPKRPKPTSAPNPDRFLPVQLGPKVFQLELALDADTRFQGLSDRPSMPADHGMLFVFTEARTMQFVMRRCLFDIDILFLDENGKVLVRHAMKMVPYNTPEWQLKRYSSIVPAQFAIEINGGLLRELDVRPGDVIELPLAELKARAR